MNVFSDIKETYYEHIMCDQQKSLLVQIHGLYKHYEGEVVYLAFSKSIYPNGVQIDQQYEIDGEKANEQVEMDDGVHSIWLTEFVWFLYIF